MRPRAKNPKRNAVAVRFDDDTLASVEAAANRKQQKIAPWVRDAAALEARRQNNEVQRCMVSPDGTVWPLPSLPNTGGGDPA